MILLNLNPAKPTTVWDICFGGNPNKGEVPKLVIDTPKALQVIVDESKQQIIIVEVK